MIAGLLRSGHPAAQIAVGEPAAARREALAKRHGVQVSDDNCAVVRDADLVVLAVKPQQMPKALKGLPACLRAEATVLSIAAGVRIASLRDGLDGHAAIVRAMPNTPALVGAGVAAVFTEAGEPHRARAIWLLSRCGEVIELEREEQMHAVTAISGSGPAYFFLLAEMMQAAGRSLGLPEALAARLAAHTALGAGKMLVESGRTAADLRQQVTSPGGTTQAALDVMYERGLPDAVRAALQAAARRSQELG